MLLLRRSRLFTAPAILLFAASLPIPALAQSSKPQAGGRPTVCVASAIGQRYEIKTVGLMVFGNDLKTTNVGSWGVDSLVVQRLAAGLGSRFSARPITISADAIKSVPPGGGIFSGGNGEEALKAFLRNHGKAGCTYIVVAKPYAGQVPNTNQSIEGLGIFKHDAIFKAYSAYAIFTLQLYDGRTAEWIRQPVDIGNIFAGAFKEKPSVRTVDETYWPASPEVVVQHAKLREATRNVVATVVTTQAQNILKALAKDQ
jgi:hypothetical protein